MLTCDKCGGAISEGSRYCPACGDPVDQRDVTSDKLVQNKTALVEINFGHSVSANFGPALDICRKIDTFKEQGEGKSTKYSVSIPITEVELIINIWDLIGSFKASRLLINGRVASKSDLVYRGIGCFRNRQKAYDKQQYCFGEQLFEFNIWGCKRMQMPLMEWGGGWIQYGNMDSRGNWIFDKAKIRHEIERKIHENELCPILNRSKIFETLDKIPDSINPNSNPNWEYIVEHREINGRWKDVATGIKPVLKRANEYVIGEYRPRWALEDDSEIESTHTIRVQIKPEVEDKKPASQISTGLGCFFILVVIFIIAIFLTC